MTCRQPGAGPVCVHLPAKMGVPQKLVVRISAKPAPATVSGHDVTVQLPKPPALLVAGAEVHVLVAVLAVTVLRFAEVVEPEANAVAS